MRAGLILLGVALLAAGVAFRAPLHRQVNLWRDRWAFRAFVRTLPATRQADVPLRMPDGVTLATDIYLPKGATGPLPAILVRLPYGKTFYAEARHWVQLFTARGYAVLVQDMRGRYGSAGTFAPYPTEAADGAATLDWIAAQPWSSGEVGTIGCSALGETQVILAARHPAHLSAMIPIGAGGAVGTAGGTYGFFGLFEGGVFQLASGYGWFARWGGKTPDHMDTGPIDYARGLATLPVRDAVRQTRPDPTDYEALLDGFSDPGYGARAGFISDADRFETPALLVDTWYDPNVSATFTLAARMPGAQVLIAPGLHCELTQAFATGTLGDLPVKGTPQPFDDIFAAFMDQHLKGAPAPKLPPYRVYVLGEDVWRDATSWPPADAAPVTFALADDTLAPGASTGSRSFTSDPMRPVPSLGGAICCTGDPASRAGPLDQRPAEGRADVLAYTSAPLAAPLRIAGPMRATLTVETDVPDTDLVLTLTDVAPDGTSLMIQTGALRLRYRTGYATPQMMVPGQPATVTVHLRDIAWLVQPGHRLRLDVAGSSFPRLARNLNGGSADPNRETVPHRARITIAAPSSLTLFSWPG